MNTVAIQICIRNTICECFDSYEWRLWRILVIRFVSVCELNTSWNGNKKRLKSKQNHYLLFYMDFFPLFKMFFFPLFKYRITFIWCQPNQSRNIIAHYRPISNSTNFFTITNKTFTFQMAFKLLMLAIIAKNVAKTTAFGYAQGGPEAGIYGHVRFLRIELNWIGYLVCIDLEHLKNWTLHVHWSITQQITVRLVAIIQVKWNVDIAKQISEIAKCVFNICGEIKSLKYAFDLCIHEIGQFVLHSFYIDIVFDIKLLHSFQIGPRKLRLTSIRLTFAATKSRIDYVFGLNFKILHSLIASQSIFAYGKVTFNIYALLHFKVQHSMDACINRDCFANLKPHLSLFTYSYLYSTLACILSEDLSFFLDSTNGKPPSAKKT